LPVPASTYAIPPALTFCPEACWRSAALSCPRVLAGLPQQTGHRDAHASHGSRQVARCATTPCASLQDRWGAQQHPARPIPVAVASSRPCMRSPSCKSLLRSGHKRSAGHASKVRSRVAEKPRREPRSTAAYPWQFTEPLEPRSMTLVHALGNFAVVTLHVTPPVFSFNSGLCSVNLDGRVTGTRHTPVLAASKPPACQAPRGEAEDSLSWCPQQPGFRAWCRRCAGATPGCF